MAGRGARAPAKMRFSIQSVFPTTVRLLAVGLALNGFAFAQSAWPQQPAGARWESPPAGSEIARSAMPEGAEADGWRQELASLRLRLEDLERETGSSGDAWRMAGDSLAPGSGTVDPAGTRGTPEPAVRQPASSDRSTAAVSAAAPSIPDERRWTVRSGGHVQLDYVNWATAAPSISGDQDYFEFRRLRLTADGSGYHNLDFRLQFTLEPESAGESLSGISATPDVKDAYLSVNEIPRIGRVRIGNFFVPFGLEQVTNDTMNIFMERSIPTQGIFTPDREVGLAVYNANPTRSVTWSGGVFFDSIGEGVKERIDDNQGYRLAGRFTWLPYFEETDDDCRLVHCGFGILHTGDHDNRIRIRARPQVHEGPRLIDSGVIDAGSFTTGNFETAIVMGRCTLQGEAYLSEIEALAGRIEARGAYLHASWFLTGEHRRFERFGQHGAQFGRNAVLRDLDIGSDPSSWGAWELKSRWSWLDLSDSGNGQYNDFTFGVNWYWNDRTRIMFDWIHPMTTADTVFGTTQSSLLGLRMDVNW